MKGTEKQIKWAEDIIADCLSALNSNIERAENCPMDTNHAIALKILRAAWKNVFGRVEDAAKVIGNRHRCSWNNISSDANRIELMLSHGKTIAEICKMYGVDAESI